MREIKEAFRRGFRRPAEPEHQELSWWDRDDVEPLWPEAPMVERVVDNRVFLFGLDGLYRSAMKKHERGELLASARHVAAVLNLPPADVPIEGYYTEDVDLTTYFRLMRALQGVPLTRASEVESLPQFRRLLGVTSSPIFGPPVRKYLLPKGHDPLSAALAAEKRVDTWTVPLLTAATARIARETDDYSLVGLAARAEDPVVLTALRESVVLYAEAVDLASGMRPTFVWRVDPDLCKAARRFVDTFNGLFGRELPPPEARYAHAFAGGFNEFGIHGRCVRLGQSDEPEPHYYHWAVLKGPTGQLEVNEFWAPEIWTTEQYLTRSRTRRDAHSRSQSVH
jgi:hypothetical protein